MGLFERMKEPVFLKEDSDAEKQLEKLREIEPLLKTEGQAKLRQDIKYLEYGIIGEKNIAFELKNSHMPMYILHDIYLENEDLSAQIDYLVFTRKICFVIECKNLYGDIEINNMGDFVRTIEFNGKKRKEGIYSPITQSQRHLELIKKIKTDQKGNKFTKFLAGKFFDDNYKAVVVLANPKTVLNAKYAKKEVKEKVIRADQLVNYIKNVYKQSNEAEISDESMLKWANSFLKLHKEVEKDYTKKYEQYRLEESAVDTKSIDIKTEQMLSNIEETDIFKELRAYRLIKSREEKIKPYFIYNDNQIKDLIFRRPKTKEELKMVSGFGETKVEKYGDDILCIMERYK